MGEELQIAGQLEPWPWGWGLSRSQDGSGTAIRPSREGAGFPFSMQSQPRPSSSRMGGERSVNSTQQPSTWRPGHCQAAPWQLAGGRSRGSA